MHFFFFDDHFCLIANSSIYHLALGSLTIRKCKLADLDLLVRYQSISGLEFYLLGVLSANNFYGQFGP